MTAVNQLHYRLSACLCLLAAAPSGRAIEFIDPAALGFGPPALTLDTTYQARLEYDRGEGGLEMSETRAVLPLGKWERGDILIGVGADYAWHRADFGGREGLGTKDLHSLEARLALSWQPKKSKWWALGFVSPGLATDFAAVDSDAFTISGLGLLGYHWSDRLDLAAGVFASYGLDETRVMGAVGFIWRPNDQWIVQATPPVVAIGWQPNRDWTLALVAYPGGGSWEVGASEEEVRQVELDLWRAAASVEKRIGDHWRVSVRGGVSFGGELELRGADSRNISSTDLEPAPFGAVALKWAF
jgi:hypothetical protein